MSLQTAIQPFFDEETGTFSYVVSDKATRCAAIIDPVLGFDSKSGHTSARAAEDILAYVQHAGLTVQWILETHAHADHLSAAGLLRERTGARVAIGEHIRDVQAAFKTIYNLDRSFIPDGSQFDHLFRDGEVFSLGQLSVSVLHVPGHTPADVAYSVDGAVFVGDTLFMPDGGTARADFPGGDARALYRSMQRLLQLAPETRLFVCHDYPKGREPRCETTVAEERAHNIHVREGTGEDEFVAMRTTRDATLDVPTLILPALQVNVRGGQLPPADDNGVAYLRIPLNVLPVRRTSTAS